MSKFDESIVELTREEAMTAFSLCEEVVNMNSPVPPSCTIDKIDNLMDKLRDSMAIEDSSISHVNMKRGLLIEEAKEYYENNKHKVKSIKVSRAQRVAFVEYLVEGIIVRNTVRYPSGLVWNKHLVRANALSLMLMNIEDYHLKFGANSVQPDEIVKGMDIVLYNGMDDVVSSGRVKSLSSDGDDGLLIGYIGGMADWYFEHSSDKTYHILSDTKAEY